MARKKRVPTIKLTVKLTMPDDQALRSAAETLDRDPNWIVGKLCHLAVGTIDLSKEVRRWLRGDTAFDAGLTGDQQALVTMGGLPDPPVVRAARRKTVAENPPTVDEVEAYLLEKNYGFDAETFHAHYRSNGWRQGKGEGRPLVDWKAACVTFQKTWLAEHKTEGPMASEPWGAHRPPEADAAVAALSTAILGDEERSDPDGEPPPDEQEEFLGDEEA
jgi:hypothetical protein